MSDGSPQTGQRVWREPDYGYGYRTYLAKGDPYFMGEGLEPGVWHSLDPKALAEMREQAWSTRPEGYEQLAGSA